MHCYVMFGANNFREHAYVNLPASRSRGNDKSRLNLAREKQGDNLRREGFVSPEGGFVTGNAGDSGARDRARSLLPLVYPLQGCCWQP